MVTQPGYALPQAHWRLYLALTKPRVVALIVFTAIVGTLMATPGLPPLHALVWGNIGIALASACAATINHVLDRRIDAQMSCEWAHNWMKSAGEPEQGSN